MLKIPTDQIRILRRAEIDHQTLEIENVSNKYIIRNEDDILNCIGSYLENVYAPKDTDDANIIHNNVINVFNSFLEHKERYENILTRLTDFNDSNLANNINNASTLDFFITCNDILYIFGKLKGKLSYGVDKIPNIILKKSPNILIFEYLTLFNNMINNGFFPKSWKVAKVIILPKKDKDTSNPINLRPISLLPNISKIFEMCTNNVITKQCRKLNVLCDKQFSFKHKHSTIHAIHMLVSNIQFNWNKNMCTGACLIDFEKAFDSIWLPALIYKMRKYDFPFHLVVLVYNMISVKQFIIGKGNIASSLIFNMSNGLQQGTVNAPLLFNIYIHDLLNKIDNIIGFADDIIIYEHGDKITNINRQLQTSFNIVEQYSLDWSMNININKCEAIIFRPSVNKCKWDIRKNWKEFKVKSIKKKY